MRRSVVLVGVDAMVSDRIVTPEKEAYLKAKLEEAVKIVMASILERDMCDVSAIASVTNTNSAD